MKKVMIAILVVLIAGLAGVLIHGRQQNHKRQQAMQQLTNEVQPLEDERTELKSQLRDEEKTISTLYQNYGKVVLTFYNYNEDQNKIAEPKMDQKKMTGNLVFTADNYPGTTGSISVDTWKKLKEKGWECAITLTAESSISKWATQWKDILASMDTEMTKVVYVPETVTETKAMEEQLRQNGFEVIVRPTQANEELIMKECEEDPWMFRSMAWNSSDAKAAFNSVKTAGGIISFGIGSQGASGNMDTKSFEDMLDQIQIAVKNKQVSVTSFLQAKSEQQSLVERTKTKKEQAQKNKADLEEKIKAIEEKLDVEYGKYEEQK